MKLQITTANKIENPPKNYGFAFIDAEDNKFKIKKCDSIIEFSKDQGGGNSLNFYKCVRVEGNTWVGLKAEKNENDWNFSETETSRLEIKGYFPVVGRIYSEDTTIWITELYKTKEGKMVCLCHFENPELYTSSWENSVCYFMDSTDTCLIKIMAQAGLNSSIAKFGDWSLFRNYLIPGGNGGISVYELPEMD